MSSISAVLIVSNEEKNLEACLESIQWVDEIVIVEDGSHDQTLEIAKRYTSKVYQRAFDHFANQKNFGLDQATGDWILSVDADERVSPELQASMQRAAQDDGPYAGYDVLRKNIILGKQLRFAGQRSEKILRFFRRDKGRFEQPIHEKVVVAGKVGTLSGELIHDSIPTMEEYFRKLNAYTDHEAKWMLEKGIKANGFDLYLKPLVRFLYFYVFRLGFLDGYQGLQYHGLSSYYSFLKYVKLRELNQKACCCQGKCHS